MTPTLDEMLAHEALIMGRPVHYVSYRDMTFRAEVGSHSIFLLVYRCDPVVHRDITMTEYRYSIWTDGVCKGGGIF